MYYELVNTPFLCPMQAFGFAHPAVQSALWLKQQAVQQAGEGSDNASLRTQLALGDVLTLVHRDTIPFKTLSALSSTGHCTGGQKAQRPQSRPPRNLHLEEQQGLVSRERADSAAPSRKRPAEPSLKDWQTQARTLLGPPQQACT